MNELEVWLWIEQVLETKKDLEDLERFTTFADLKRQFEERLLLDEIFQTDDSTQHESGKGSSEGEDRLPRGDASISDNRSDCTRSSEEGTP